MHAVMDLYTRRDGLCRRGKWKCMLLSVFGESNVSEIRTAGLSCNVQTLAIEGDI